MDAEHAWRLNEDPLGARPQHPCSPVEKLANRLGTETSERGWGKMENISWGSG